MVRNAPANSGGIRDTGVQSLDGEDSLEEGMATHSTILAGESQGRRSLAGSSPWGCKDLDTTEVT